MKTLGLALICSLAAHATVVWQEPAVLAKEDTGAPAPPFQFQREELGGTSPKVVVRDSKGVTWFVKFGTEAKPEAFAARIARAAGYFAPITYYVADGAIQGVPGKLKRADRAIEAGTGHFRDARFAREMRLVDGASWSLDESSLRHTKELSGLKLIVLLTSNWDIKPPNFAVVEAGGNRMYAITDWGQSLGAPDMKTHWNCGQFRDGNKWFTHGVEDGYLYMQFGGKASDVITNGIRVEHAQWLLRQLKGLTTERVRQMLTDSGATPDEVACFSSAFAQRLATLRAGLTDTE